jgi:glycosyltransferase involved in cell wall biosynthesis
MKAKTIVSFRGGDILVAPFVDPIWRKYLIEEMFPELTCVHFISYAMRDLAREFATNQDNFYVIPMGIETNLFNPSAEKSINQCVNLVTTARLSWQKGLPYALEVVKNLVDKGYDVKYHIIGDGPLRTELKYLTHILGLQDHIIFHGKVNLYEVQNILFDCDIYLQPSITENLCIATIEAMSMKLPIVASDVGALPELVTDNETGFLVPIINPEQFTESIEKLIHDPALRKKFGEKGREVVLDKYTIETERARWLEMYSRL